LYEQTLYVIDTEQDRVIEKITDLRENAEEVVISLDGKKVCIIHRNPDPTQNSQMTILHLEKKQINIKNQKWWKHKLMKKDSKEHREDWVEVGKDPRAIAVMAVKKDERICHIAFIASYGGQNVTCVDVDYPTLQSIQPFQTVQHTPFL
jgi:hypothetical protein